jgi:hypothetical protein
MKPPELYDLLHPGALTVIKFYRDGSDSFTTDIVSLSKESPVFTKGEVRRLIPSGSTWVHAIGWRSITGLYVRAQGQRWFALGVEEVLSHSHRGGYPTYYGYIYSQIPEVIDALRRLRSWIEVAHVPTIPTLVESRAPRGALVLESDAHHPEEHRSVEYWIINEALRAFNSNDRLQFRTLVLSEMQLFELIQPSLQDMIGQAVLPEDFLLGTTQLIKASFSQKVNNWLDAHRYSRVTIGSR